MATYSGTPINGAIPNLRAVSVITACLLGGPVVGFGAGLIAGGHRFLIDIGGLTALPCGLATFLEGVGAGIVSSRMKQGVLNWRVAVLLGLLGESLHMGMVLAMARPFETALSVVKVIGMPMILLNAIGAGCLLEVLHRVVRDRERRASIQARKAMTIANIVAPLKKSGQPIGTLKFYGAKNQLLNHTDFEIAVGLADLFSTQLELEDIQIKTQLLAACRFRMSYLRRSVMGRKREWECPPVLPIPIWDFSAGGHTSRFYG